MHLTAQDLKLIEKYNRPGPRYTSYPPANHFTEHKDFSGLLRSLSEEQAPLSLYFHLPFCETLCWFCGCNMITSLDKSRADDYLDLLEKELALYEPLIASGRKAEQLHFGGGTPNFFGADQIDRLAELIDRHFKFSADAEKSVELDPRRLTAPQVEAFARMGITRASFGVQDCDPDVQKSIHRIQPQSVNVEAMDLLRSNGFESINLDLIYGLPKQSPDSFNRTIDDVLSLQPDRFAVFNYAHVPWMAPAQKILERIGLPDAETKMQLLKLCIERLAEAGYVYIGMDHFALPSDELVVAQQEGTLQRNFQGYSTRAGVEICGFGISSISQGANGFRQNVKDLESYRARVEAGTIPVAKGYALTEEDKLRADVIMRLMCDMALDFEVMGKKWSIDFRSHFAVALGQFEGFVKDGLLKWTETGCRVTDHGRLFIRNLAMCFDAYLEPSSESRYSRTV